MIQGCTTSVEVNAQERTLAPFFLIVLNFFSLSVDVEEEKGAAFPFGLSVRNCKRRRKTTIHLAHQPKFKMSLWFGSLFQLACLFSFHPTLFGCSFMLGVVNVQKFTLVFLNAEEHRSTTYQKKKRWSWTILCHTGLKNVDSLNQPGVFCLYKAGMRAHFNKTDVWLVKTCKSWSLVMFSGFTFQKNCE